MAAPRKLLSIAHSYCVTLNRRLAWEMQREGQGRWDISSVAPSKFQGDLGSIRTVEDAREACQLIPVDTYLDRPIHLMFFGSKLRRILQENWTFVHCWEEPYILAGAQIMKWTPPTTPIAFWTAQNIAKQYPQPFRAFEEYCVRRTSGWMAAGETIVQTLAQKPGYAKKPWRVLPLGVDTEFFQPDKNMGAQVRSELGWDDRADLPVVGYLGRFVSEKGLTLLMRAMEGLKRPFRALFVGGGPMQNELKEWGNAYGDNVRVVTGVSHDRVPAMLNAMDLLCAPSQTTGKWKEQFGRMLVEAFACGLPVVASDSGEIPYVVADAGEICPEADIASWTQTLEKLLNDPDARTALALRGLDRAHTHYSWPVVARKHIDFFEELL